MSSTDRGRAAAPPRPRRASLALGFAALACAAAFAFVVEAGAQTTTPIVADPSSWPRGRSAVARDAAIEAEVARLLAAMSVEEKVGQILQADVSSVTAEDVRRYRLGSILAGGNSGPGGDDRAPASAWLAAADAFYDASMSPPAGRPAIPVMWGIDAVHGNANIFGATIFPHNIGLGAMRNPALVRRIGEVTAIELRVIGLDWNFGPTLAVVRDDRWGRTYESYSEDPRIVAQYARAMVEGLQGRPGSPDFLGPARVIATAKHFLGDGGTTGGRDQGDNAASERDLRRIHAAGYAPAIAAGVQAVMASYNSWHGEKMHGRRDLLTDVLVGRLGHDGLVVGDWDGHGQVRGCTPQSCAASFNAGVDMFMAPGSWRELYANTLAQVRSGQITMARLDEAVSRILRVKLRAGLFTEGRPSSRRFAGEWRLLGAPAHRAVARQAVRESLVLLKNDNRVLPLSPRARVLVAGDGADDVGKQSGGWTISWQGTGNARADFPNASTIFEGVRAAVEAAGGSAQLSVDGAFTDRPDVAIVVIGEDPYAEFQGDVPNLDYQAGTDRDLGLIRRLKAAGIPVVVVFLSGRPLYVTPEINAADAFVAAWLPGSEGAGIADVLFRAPDGSIAHDFRGRLSFSWPRAPDQTPLNVGDRRYDPLFPYGYGLTYRSRRTLGRLPEATAAGASAAANVSRFIENGRALPPWTIALSSAGATPDASAGGAAGNRALVLTSAGDAISAAWSGAALASMSVRGAQIDLTRQSNGDMALALDVRVDARPAAPVSLAVGCGAACRGAIDITSWLRDAAGDGWSRLQIRLSCFRAAGADLAVVEAPMEIATSGAQTLAIRNVRLVPGEGTPTCPGGQ